LYKKKAATFKMKKYSRNAIKDELEDSGLLGFYVA
jgi:hypothetical protein